jgi:hypothetical protein
MSGNCKRKSIGQLAKKCTVVLRQKVAGADSIFSGKKVALQFVGYDSEQQAADAAYASCEHAKCEQCRSKNMPTWWDDTGLKPAPAQAVMTGKSCGPPPGRVVKSTTYGSNGNCTHTFESGCEVKFQASYCRDMFSGNWE